MGLSSVKSEEHPIAMALRDDLTKLIGDLPGIECRASRWSDQPAFFLGGREVAHLHDGNVVDIRLTRAVIRKLGLREQKDGGMVLRGSSDWAEYSFARRADLERALVLVNYVISANS